eukprot:1160156-Pelagomonas_calceolata.AAC.1
MGLKKKIFKFGNFLEGSRQICENGFPLGPALGIPASATLLLAWFAWFFAKASARSSPAMPAWDFTVWMEISCVMAGKIAANAARHMEAFAVFKSRHGIESRVVADTVQIPVGFWCSCNQAQFVKVVFELPGWNCAAPYLFVTSHATEYPM